MAILAADEFFVLGKKTIESGDLIPFDEEIKFPASNGVDQICRLTKEGLFVKRSGDTWDKCVEEFVAYRGRLYLCFPGYRPVLYRCGGVGYAQTCPEGAVLDDTVFLSKNKKTQVTSTITVPGRRIWIAGD